MISSYNLSCTSGFRDSKNIVLVSVVAVVSKPANKNNTDCKINVTTSNVKCTLTVYQIYLSNNDFVHFFSAPKRNIFTTDSFSVFQNSLCRDFDKVVVFLHYQNNNFRTTIIAETLLGCMFFNV